MALKTLPLFVASGLLQIFPTASASSCSVTLYTGQDYTGDSYGPFDVGSYKCCPDVYFPNDQINSVVATATGQDCTVRIYAGAPTDNNGYDWFEYYVLDGQTRRINHQTCPDDDFDHPNSVSFTVWDEDYTQFSWMIISAVASENSEFVSVTPDASQASEGAIALSLIENDGNELVDGCYQCSNAENNQFCSKLEIESLQCEESETEVIELVVFAQKIKGDTDFFTIISKDNDFIAFLNDYAHPKNGVRVKSDWFARSSGNEQQLGGVFVTPSCGADYLQNSGRLDIEDIWQRATPGRGHFGNRLVLSGNDYQDWTLLTEEEETVGEASLDNEITIRIQNDPVNGLSASLASDAVSCTSGCSWDGVSFDTSTDTKYKILFAADSGIIQICQVSVRRECQSTV